MSADETWSFVLNEPLLGVLLGDPEAIPDECDEALADAVRDLPPTDRSILRLKAVGEFKYREIADILQRQKRCQEPFRRYH